MHEREAKAREAVVEAGRRLLERGLVARTWGNVSARVSEHLFVITPSGRAYEHLRPEDLVLLDCQDLAKLGRQKPSSEKGIHADAYRLRPEVNFVIHTHQDMASILSTLGQGGSVPCAAYGLPSTDLLRRAVKAQWLTHPESRVMLLKRHGALCLGESMEEAFQIAQALEDYCAGVVAPYLDGVEKIAVPKDLGRSIRCGSLYELDLGWTKKTCRVGDLTARGAAAFHGAIYRLTSARAVLHCTDLYVVELSRRGENLRPMLDDLAQIAGSEILSLPPSPRRLAAALIPANAVLVKGFGALCTGNTLEDAETVEKLLVKGCRAWRFAKAHPQATPLSQADAILQRTLYVTKYAKRKK